MTGTKPMIWSGEHHFEVDGSGLHEDTLRIGRAQPQGERMLTLVLPTLCITYADMVFQNAVGGVQMSYPGSAVYGPAFFDPPVELTGDDIERLTYVRGADRVVIGRERTVVEFGSWEELVIPRLRIGAGVGAPAALAVASTSIDVEAPLSIAVKQYADGRHVGGLAVEARHQDYVESTPEPVYDLWARVVDGRRREPLPEVIVEVWGWDPRAEREGGVGGFVAVAEVATDGHGIAQTGGLRAGQLQWYSARLEGWRVAPRCLRPLPQQSVRLHLLAWEMTPDRDATQYELERGASIPVQRYEATYRAESWETLDEVARRFGFAGANELAESGGLRHPDQYTGAADFTLPGWALLHAPAGDTSTLLDRRLDLPSGSTIAAHRLYRPVPDALVPGEVVAVPTEPSRRR